MRFTKNKYKQQRKINIKTLNVFEGLIWSCTHRDLSARLIFLVDSREKLYWAIPLLTFKTKNIYLI